MLNYQRVTSMEKSESSHLASRGTFRNQPGPTPNLPGTRVICKAWRFSDVSWSHAMVSVSPLWLPMALWIDVFPLGVDFHQWDQWDLASGGNIQIAVMAVIWIQRKSGFHQDFVGLSLAISQQRIGVVQTSAAKGHLLRCRFAVDPLGLIH